METIDTQDVVDLTNIPLDLLEFRDATQKALSIRTCSTPNTRKAAISATAIILGAEADLLKYCKDPDCSEDVHRLANQLLTASHPKSLDLDLGFGIPWGREKLRTLTFELAEDAVAAGCNLLSREPEGLRVKECIGFGMLLEDAKKHGHKIGPRKEVLIQYCRKVEAAVRDGNYNAKIGYVPYHDPNQMTFSFLSQI